MPMDRVQPSTSPDQKSPTVLSIECLKGTSTADEWTGDFLQTGDIVEELRIGNSGRFKSPFKNGKSGVQKVLHESFKKKETSILVRVRRGVDEFAELQACIVPNDSVSQKKQYMLRSIADPNYAVGFLDRSESDCLQLQASRSDRMVNELSRTRLQDGYVSYQWERRMQEFLSVPFSSCFLSILLLPKASDQGASHYNNLEDTLARANAWLNASQASGVPIVFMNVQTESLLTKISGKTASSTVNAGSLSDLSNLANASLYGFEDYHGVDIGVVRAVRLWYASLGGEFAIEIKLREDDTKLGFAISRTEEGFIFISSVIDDDENAPSTRSGLHNLYKEATNSSRLLVVSRVANQKVLPWIVSSTGAIRCFDTVSLSQKLSLHRHANSLIVQKKPLYLSFAFPLFSLFVCSLVRKYGATKNTKLRAQTLAPTTTTMNCSISGEVPEEPVVSTKSGLLYEKRLIERHISDYGKCPVTGDPLTMDDIVPIKTGKIVKPRPLQAASIPGMLGMFQNEWDSLMLANFALEQQLHTARQELSHALYQHDAACRVIARLKKERDEARSLLAQADRQIPMSASMAANAPALSNGKRAAEDEEFGPGGKRIRPGISASIIGELTDCNAALSQQRKKRQIPPTVATVDALERYTQISSHPLHKTSKPGVVSLDIHYDKDIIATGGLDTNAVLFDRPSGQILSTLSGHSKKVTSLKFVARGDLFLTGSADKTVRVWQESDNGNYNCRQILKDHTAEVQAITVHATNNYFVTASLDSTWCFYELSSGLCLTQVVDSTDSSGYTSAAFHPDGLILGTGTAEAIVKIWDVKSQANVARFDGHVGAVTSISFSENGYFLATAAHDGVKLWDLRKLRNFRTFSPYDSETPTNSVEFDNSGCYLALSGSDIRVYQVANVKSEWNCIKTFPDLSGTGKASCVKFGPDAKYLAVGSMDRNLRIFGLPSEDGPLES